MGKPTEARVEKRNLKDLKQFPLQTQFFDELPDHDLRGLAADIRRNGLRQKIEVLPKIKAGFPANTILRGHQRRRALLLNGVESVEVLVRYDLADAAAAAIEREFLCDNQHRRQLDLLSKARVALRLFELEKNRNRGGLSAGEQDEARDRVGKTIEMSGRNLARYFSVLRAPFEIQEAFRAGRLSLVLAAKVAGLEPNVQQRIVQQARADAEKLAGLAAKRQRLADQARKDETKLPDLAAADKALARAKGQARESLAALVTGHLSTVPAQSIGTALTKLLIALSRARRDLGGRIQDVSRHTFAAEVGRLREGQALLRRLIDRATSGSEEEEEE